MIGSIYQQLGIDPEGSLPNPRGLDLKVMPTHVAEGDEMPRGGRLTEIV